MEKFKTKKYIKSSKKHIIILLKYVLVVFWFISKLNELFKNASFQVIITSSFSTQKTYVIINYESKDFSWTDNSRSVLIGYTDGNKKVLQSLYSSTNNYPTPLDIFTKKGNIGKKIKKRISI